MAEYWFWNLRNTVRFDRAVAAAVAGQIDTFVELAEHPTLQFALQENLDVLAAQSATVVGTSDRQASDLTEFTRNLGVLAVNDIDYRWDVLRTESVGAATLPLLDFPNTQMNESSLWLPYHGVAPVPAARWGDGAARAGRPATAGHRRGMDRADPALDGCRLGASASSITPAAAISPPHCARTPKARSCPHD